MKDYIYYIVGHRYPPPPPVVSLYSPFLLPDISSSSRMFSLAWVICTPLRISSPLPKTVIAVADNFVGLAKDAIPLLRPPSPRARTSVTVSGLLCPRRRSPYLCNYGGLPYPSPNLAAGYLAVTKEFFTFLEDYQRFSLFSKDVLTFSEEFRTKELHTLARQYIPP